MKLGTRKLLLAAAACLASFSTPHAWAEELPLEERCDIPGGSLSSHAEADAKACRDSCAKQTSCRSFVHVSGWNRCFLKGEKATRKFALRLVSGHVETDKDDKRKIADSGPDRDYSGKDMRNVTGLKNHEACASACLEESKCAAFVYMEGYNSCWLKSSKGVAKTKVFSCGVRGVK